MIIHILATDKKDSIVVDVTSGWLFGFPKKCPAEIISDPKKFKIWLVENGYPKQLITEELIIRVLK